MYKKEVIINGKKYSYYYYNLREEGKVKNICLGGDKKSYLNVFESDLGGRNL